MNIAYTWLILGIILLALEAFGLPGMGMLFAGLAAITVAVLLSAGALQPDATLLQIIVFLITTTIWAIALWKPMQKYRPGFRKLGGYNNIVGETAYVGSAGLTKGMPGEVTWSGTIMKAELVSGSSVERVEAGAPVTIAKIEGTTLYVTPKS